MKWKFFEPDDDDDDVIVYRATSNKSGLKYVINFEKYTGDEGNYSLSFAEAKSKDYSASLNAGDMFSIMATIIEICKHFIDRFDVGSILYSAAEDKKSQEGNENRREKLYMEYVKKNIKKISPNAKVVIDRGENVSIIIDK
jgi:hypothetical protein